VKEKITASTCRACGLCCVALSDSSNVYCDVSEEDMKKLGTAFVKKHVRLLSPFDRAVALIDGGFCPPGAIKTEWRTTKTGPLKGVQVHVCVALRGSLMHKTSCSVYAKRPKTCKTACVPGDRACSQVRRDMLKLLKEREG
jgi:Fe-S-cluster containining protein